MKDRSGAVCRPLDSASYYTDKVKVKVKSLSCIQLFVIHGLHPPGSSVHGIFQVRILEWVAISFSRDLPDPGRELAASTWQVDSLPLSHQGSPNIAKHLFILINLKIL